MSFYETYHDLKRRHAQAVLLFISRGLASCYWDDAKAVARLLGLHCDRASDGPTSGVCRATFPEAVLDRNRFILTLGGLSIVVIRGVQIEARKSKWQSSKPSTRPKYNPSQKQIAAAAAEIRSGWTEAESESRLSVQGVVPYELLQARDSLFYGHTDQTGRRYVKK